MAKFVIQCPKCGNYTTASTSFFAKSYVECSCGNLIDVKKDKLTQRKCVSCGNVVVYDQSKGEKAKCPVCKKQILDKDDLKNTVDIFCPTCSSKINVSKYDKKCTCSLCKTTIDVQEQISKIKASESGLASVIKYEGGNDVFVWKHPVEDFNFGSQLIVHETQEAIFFKDGEALDLFGAGRYTLSTQNLPLLEKLSKLPVDANTIFHSEVYFINLVTQLGVKWGTDSKVRLFDPISSLHLEIGACGQFNIQVVNSRKLLLKIVGTTSGTSQSELVGSNYTISGMTGKFKALIVSKVKTYLAKSIRENDINILEVDEHLDLLSASIKEKINEVLKDYGLFMPEFFITTVVTPDDDPNFKRLKQQHADRYLKVQEERILTEEAIARKGRRQIEAEEEIIIAQGHAGAYVAQAAAEAEEMKLKGYTYAQETQRQVAVGAVTNEGKGNSNNVGGMDSLMHLGVGLGVMGEVIENVKKAVKPVANQTTEVGAAVASTVKESWNCTNCGTNGITSNFCPNCGNKKPELNANWICPNCGTKDIASKFCPNCGTKREA